MNNRWLLLLMLLPLAIAACKPEPPQPSPAQLTRLLGGDDTRGFLQALAPREFHFPADHGSHPGFRNEWWYITGNLDAQDRRFGFQVTFFRFALIPSAVEERESAWATSDIWMAHVALTDVEGRHHQAEERFARGALELAGAEFNPFRVWLEDWSLLGRGNHFPWQLRIKSERFELDLELDQLRPPLLQGRDGLSQKSARPGNASYYYSISRLSTRGTLTLDGERLQVEGLSWLDREWSTSSLGEDQAGWDWFSLHLNDGTDLMYYRLRNHAGDADSHSAGTLLFEDGTIRSLGPDDVVLEPKRWWQSPAGTRYPILWEVTIEPLARSFVVAAVMDEQEMDLSVTYWEGAVDVLQADQSVGRGYLEMTGY